MDGDSEAAQVSSDAESVDGIVAENDRGGSFPRAR
jgi:hypothetical protein